MNVVATRRAWGSPSRSPTTRTADGTDTSSGEFERHRFRRRHRTDELLGRRCEQRPLRARQRRQLAGNQDGSASDHRPWRSRGPARTSPVATPIRRMVASADVDRRWLAAARSRPDGSHGVVLARDGEPEHGRHAIVTCADRWCRRAARRRVERRQGPADRGRQGFGIEVLFAGRRTSIGPEYGDDPAGRRPGGSASATDSGNGEIADPVVCIGRGMLLGQDRRARAPRAPGSGRARSSSAR